MSYSPLKTKLTKTNSTVAPEDASVNRRVRISDWTVEVISTKGIEMRDKAIIWLEEKAGSA